LNKRILFTGATSGLGKYAACELAYKGNQVLVLARNKERGIQLTDFYRSNYPNGKGTLSIVECDLSSFESITKASIEIKKTLPVIDALINNAGIWNFQYKTSKNNIEETFHVNVLAPLLIIHLMLKNLEKSSDARIINTASAYHFGSIDFDNIEMKENYSGANAYRQSKLSVVLFTRHIHQLLSKSNITCYSLHPGVISTDLTREGSKLFQILFNLVGSSPQKGAQPLIYLTTTSKELLKNGEYYSKKKAKRSKPESNNLQTAEKLFNLSQKYLKNYLKFDSLIYSTREQ